MDTPKHFRDAFATLLDGKRNQERFASARDLKTQRGLHGASRHANVSCSRFDPPRSRRYAKGDECDTDLPESGVGAPSRRKRLEGGHPGAAAEARD